MLFAETLAKRIQKVLLLNGIKDTSTLSKDKYEKIVSPVIKETVNKFFKV